MKRKSPDHAAISVAQVLELGDVPWLLNLPCFVTAAERAHSVCKGHPERQRAEGISPRPSFLLPKIPYLVAPQEEHRYPVVTVSSYAADTSTFSEYASLTTLYS